MQVQVIHSGGLYAERVRSALDRQHPGTVTGFQMPAQLPLMIDDPEELLPGQLGEAEVIIAINLHPDLLLEIPHFVRGKQARALIAPIEDHGWIRPGLQRQVTAACAQAGLESAFPKPFCALEATTPAIIEFCQLYRAGRPEFRITVSEGKIEKVEMVTGSPCGLSGAVVTGLAGRPIAGAVQQAALLHHTFPCLATMVIDEERGDTLMHYSVEIQKRAVGKAIEG